jgi:hypothetical protein
MKTYNISKYSKFLKVENDNSEPFLFLKELKIKHSDIKVALEGHFVCLDYH